MASFPCFTAHALILGSDLEQGLMYGAGKEELVSTGEFLVNVRSRDREFHFKLLI
jgi:hypothetical protein